MSTDASLLRLPKSLESGSVSSDEDDDEDIVNNNSLPNAPDSGNINGNLDIPRGAIARNSRRRQSAVTFRVR